MKMPFSVSGYRLKAEFHGASVVHTIYKGAEDHLSNPASVVHSREPRKPTMLLLYNRSDHLCTCLT